MFLVFCCLKEISKKNDFESSLDQKVHAVLEEKTASAGSKTKEQNRAETATLTSHTEPRDNTNSPRLNSSHSPQAIQAGDNAGALHTEQAVSSWHPGHSWGHDHLQGSHRQSGMAQGHPGTRSPKPH